MRELLHHFQTLARYNRLANETLYPRCAELRDEEYRRQRKVSFGSVHALLNHILLGDRIWMSRFEGGGSTTPPLSTILYDDFAALRGARSSEDERIETFFRDADPASFDRELRYTNSKGITYTDRLPMAVAHMFNHQTHHRGQIHAMLSQTDVQPPSLDLHRIIHP
jgi:uncharacterized damage-inducible protein DinB